MEVFQEYARYYNALYKDKDYMAEARSVDSLLKKYGSNIHSLIMYGCGTGSHDRCLEKMGYEVYGIDISEEMIEEARRNSDTIVYEVADVRSYISKRKFDAVVSLFHVMSYQNTNEDVCRAFCSARNLLEAGGIFLFDVWYGPGVLTDLPSLRIKEVEDEENKILRIAQPELHADTDVVDVNYKMFVTNKHTNISKRIEEKHCMRYFFRPEIDKYLKEANFRIVDCVDCRTLKLADYSSWTSYFVAEAV